jgi:RNA polymerase sigma-70 factor (ECF subfamily)
MKTWVEKLRKEYAQSEKKLDAYRKTLQDPEMMDELAIVEDMIADMHYAMEWMRTGREPHKRRGLDIHDAYSRSILMDMELLPASTTARQELRATESQKVELVQILMKLSNRERQCFLLHTAHGLSMAEIGKELKISKASVQKNIERARAKI